MEGNNIEIWKTSCHSDRYEVSSLGRVRGPSGKILKPTLLQIGYYSIAFSYKNHVVKRFYIHRLVADTFIGAIDKNMVVNHKNHDKTDNRLVNLEIVSRKDNGKHWAQQHRSQAAGRKRSGFCGRGHKLDDNKSYCNICRNMKNSGIEFMPPNDTEWQESIVPDYLISKDGRLWSNKTSRLIKAGVNKAGYVYANLRINGKTKPFAIHRLVAETFIDALKKDQVVDHIDGDKTNNNLTNLRITSRSENTTHFRDRVRDEDNHGYKLSKEQVIQIKILLNEGKLSQKEIGKRFGVVDSHISAIKNKRKWTHIE